MKHLITMAALSLMVVSLFAVPAKKGIFTLNQPNGTTIEVRLCGDEYYHYYTNLDGDMLEQNSEGYYVICEKQPDAAELTAERERRMVRRSRQHYDKAPHKPVKGMAILVSFKDVKFQKTNQNFVDLLNKKGYNYNGATGSASDYFKDVSNGQYTPSFDVYGPYVLDHNMSYYGSNDKYDQDMHPDQMVVDAVAKLAADKKANINFANYDSDNDGNIDNIFIYYAGYGENEGSSTQAIWPHAWEVYPEYVDGKLTYNGKNIKGYACTSELQGKSGSVMCGIGTFCHEFGHILGLPDFYETTYASGHKTAGDWDIMDAGSYLNNGNTPPSYSAHERFFLGWMTPKIINTPGDYTLEHIATSNEAYIITATGTHNLVGHNPNPRTFFLLENRQNEGWDKYLPGHGLMISKTMYDPVKWRENTPNNDRNSQGYDIIEADGKAPDGSYGKAGDLFPGPSMVDTFTPFSQYPITNIKEENGIITFTLMENGAGDNEENEDFVGDAFVETFDRLTLENSLEITDKIDQYADNSGWTGSKLFCNNGQLKLGSNKYWGYALTPSFQFTGEIKVEFEASSKSSTNINISFEDMSSKMSEPMGTDMRIYSFIINDYPKGAKVKIFADANVFYLDNVKIGPIKTTSIDLTDDLNVVLVNRNNECSLHNLPISSFIKCFDLSGRVLWQIESKADEITFDKPEGFYLLQIKSGDKTTVLKGI